MSRRRRLAAPRTRPCVPSGLNAGDSGPSTVVELDPLLDLAGHDVLDDERLVLLGAREVREPVADRRPGDPRHEVAAQAAGRARCTRSRGPCRSPSSGCRMNWPSFAEIRMMSSSWSLRLPTTAAIMSPVGDGSIESDRRRSRVRSRVGREVAPVVGRPLLVAERLEPLLQVAIELLVEVLGLELQRFLVGALAAADARSCAARTGTAAGLPCPTSIR